MVSLSSFNLAFTKASTPGSNLSFLFKAVEYMSAIVGLLIKSNEVLIGTPNAVKLPTKLKADLFNPSLATNLSFALSVAIVIKEEMISCFLIAPPAIIKIALLSTLSVLKTSILLVLKILLSLII